MAWWDKETKTIEKDMRKRRELVSGEDGQPS